MSLFGPVHLALLLTIVSAAVTLSWLCRKRKLPLLNVRLVLAYGIAANELVWWGFRYSHEGVHLTNLPLQLCDLTVWMAVLACLTKIPLIVEFTYFAGVIGSGIGRSHPRPGVLVWDAGTFKALVDSVPVWHQNMIRFTSGHLRELEERFRELATERVAARVARQLIRLKEQIGSAEKGAGEIGVSREALAQMTGILALAPLKLKTGDRPEANS